MKDTTKKAAAKIAMKASPVLILGLVGVLIWAFSGQAEKSGGEPGADAEATVAEFHRMMAAGRWEEAESLCTEGMHGYIERFRGEWEECMEKDSAVLTAASAMLSGMKVSVSGKAKDGDGKMRVEYELSSGIGGQVPKEKTAELRREEQGWRIERIRDRR